MDMIEYLDIFIMIMILMINKLNVRSVYTTTTSTSCAHLHLARDPSSGSPQGQLQWWKSDLDAASAASSTDALRTH